MPSKEEIQRPNAHHNDNCPGCRDWGHLRLFWVTFGRLSVKKPLVDLAPESHPCRHDKTIAVIVQLVVFFVDCILLSCFPERAANWAQDGGFTTKIHRRPDGLGLPIAAELTGGEAADCSSHPDIIKSAGPKPKVPLADKG